MPVKTEETSAPATVTGSPLQTPTPETDKPVAGKKEPVFANVGELLMAAKELGISRNDVLAQLNKKAAEDLKVEDFPGAWKVIREFAEFLKTHK